MQVPLRVNKVGHYSLSVVDFREDSSRSASKCPEASASLAYLVRKRPNLPNGGFHLPYTLRGLCRLESPRTAAASAAVTLGDARDGSLKDRLKIASAKQLKRDAASM